MSLSVLSSNDVSRFLLKRPPASIGVTPGKGMDFFRICITLLEEDEGEEALHQWLFGAKSLIDFMVAYFEPVYVILSTLLLANVLRPAPSLARRYRPQEWLSHISVQPPGKRPPLLSPLSLTKYPKSCLKSAIRRDVKSMVMEYSSNQSWKKQRSRQGTASDRQHHICLRSPRHVHRLSYLLFTHTFQM